MKHLPFKEIIFLLLLIFSLGAIVLFREQIQELRLKALGKPAKILVETTVSLGPLPRPWEALAQGGEETSETTLSPVVPEISLLKPKYIRLDHIFDFYGVVGGENNGRMTYNFEKLDRLVSDILKTGANPMFSLSYMPPVISSGSVTDPPVFWSDWQAVVKATVEHYSGRGRYNLSDVYYEVWNEPDLFGKWKIGRHPDYRLLYKYAVAGANSAQNVNPFKIGGPGTTAIYKNWLDKFLEYILRENLRLDFLSWHRYSQNPEIFLEDVNQIENWLAKHGGFYLLPKFITEWGSNSENSPSHDTAFDAAHLVATMRKLLHRVDLAFVFEIKDGPAPTGEKYWGRFGLLTHEKAGGRRKPKYEALRLLNQMGINQVRVSGEGTWVTGFATQDGKTTKLILVNYDSYGRHSESVPLTFLGLPDGEYLLRQTSLLGKTETKGEIVEGGIFTKTLFLPANTLLLVELVKI